MVFKVSLDLQEEMDPLDAEAPPALTELLDFKEHKEQLEPQDQLDPKELVVPSDPLDPVEFKEFKALAACKDLMVFQEHLDHLDLEE